ncbi:hypothetical protein [Curtobacterium oceanosedimentum]|uniref:MmyB family transcriptional regulator n=1 Tax=Curtobacterium oceanosedimentum TaxID=465820 RepID=UPI001379F2A9
MKRPPLQWPVRGALTDHEHPNLARWVFLAPDARDALPDWTAVAQRLRARAGLHPGAAGYRELESHLRRARAWLSVADGPPAARRRRCSCASASRFRSTMSTTSAADCVVLLGVFSPRKASWPGHFPYIVSQTKSGRPC